MNLDELEELFSGDTIGSLVELRLGEDEIWFYREFSDYRNMGNLQIALQRRLHELVRDKLESYEDLDEYLQCIERIGSTLVYFCGLNFRFGWIKIPIEDFLDTALGAVEARKGIVQLKNETDGLYHSMLSQLDQPSRAVLRAYYRASLAYSLVYFRWALYCGYKDCSALISVVDSNLADNDRLQRIKYILLEEPIPYFKHLFNDIQNELS